MYRVSGPGDGQASLNNPRLANMMYQAAEAKFSTDAFDPAAENLLHGLEGVATSIFNVPSFKFERAVTERIPPGPGWGDVLIAEWSVNEAFGKGSIILTDTPYYSDYTLRLAGCRIASQADLTNFLHALMAPPGGRTAAPAATPSRPPHFELPPTSVSIDEDFPRSPAFWGSRLGTQSASFLADFEFAGVRQAKEWYLHFGVGKGYRSYPFTAPPATADLLVGSAYIPERFPLLADLIKSWSSGQIRKRWDARWNRSTEWSSQAAGTRY